MKKQWLVTILMSLFVLLVACDEGQEVDEASESDSNEDVTSESDATELELWTFVELHNDFFVDAAERWNETYPDRQIKLNAQTYPWDQMHNNLLLALQSGEGAPDLSDVEMTRFPAFVEGDPQFLPMNEYVEPEIDSFVESRFEIYSKEGNFYGMPTHVGASVMFYNTELMEKAGVDITQIETWDDFKEAGQKVVDETDAMMLNTFPSSELQIYQLVSQQQSDFVDEEGNITLNNEKNVQALELLVEMQDMGIAEVAPGGAPDEEEFYSYVNEGNVAAVSMPVWYMGRFTDYMPDLEGKMEIQPLPAFEEGGNRSAGMGGTSTVVTNQTEHAELAQDFLAFAKLSEEGNIKLWSLLGFDPPRHDVWDDPAMEEDNKFTQYFGNDIFGTLEQLKDDINPLNINENTFEVTNELNTNTLNNVLRYEDTSAKEALDEAQEKLEAQLGD